jgi:hypothetical protein
MNLFAWVMNAVVYDALKMNRPPKPSGRGSDIPE